MCRATSRVEQLRAHALEQLACPPPAEPQLLQGRAWLTTAGEQWTVIRRGRVTAAILGGLTPVIDDGELLAGKFCRRALTPDEAAELTSFKSAAEPAMAPVLGQRAHMAIDIEKLLRLGIHELQRTIEGYRARLDPARPAELEQDAFYRACLIALEAVCDYTQRHAELAATLAAAETDPARRAELENLAAVCRRVPAFPAQTFDEAVQSVHFVNFCLCAGQRMRMFQFGRPDRYLLPFYRRDLAAGRLTPADARELIDCLGIMLSEYTPRGLAVGWMLGGRDAAGVDVCNELTALFLDSIERVRLSYPAVGLCWTPDIPRPIMAQISRLLAAGLTHPALFNDDLISAGLMEAGLPPAEACLYQHSTCVENTPIASSNVYVANPYVNLVQLLHDTLGLPPAVPATTPAAEPVAAAAGRRSAPSRHRTEHDPGHPPLQRRLPAAVVLRQRLPGPRLRYRPWRCALQLDRAFLCGPIQPGGFAGCDAQVRL